MICPYIILLSGTPGTGKTSISNLLSKKFGWEVFSFGNFIAENHLYLREDKYRNTKIIDMETCSIKGFIEVLNIWIRKMNSLKGSEAEETHNIPIVVDSHYADIIIDGLIEFKTNPKKFLLDLNSIQSINDLNPCLLKVLKYENIVGIVLRCEPLELEKRLIERKYSQQKIFENIQAEILGDCTKNMIEVLKEKHVFEIDTSEHNFDQSIEIINSIVKNHEHSKKYLVGQINWLKLMSKNDKYDKFFRGDLGAITNININESGDIFYDLKDDDHEF